MSLKELRLVGPTSTGGAATIVGSRAVVGRLYAVQWLVGDLAAGVDAVLSTIRHDAGKTLLTLTDANANALYYPRDLVHGETGTALTGTAGGDRCLPLLVGVPQLVIAAGGYVKTGGCILFYLEE